MKQEIGEKNMCEVTNEFISGKIINIIDEKYFVIVENDEQIEAKKAFSFLIKLQIDDIVLICRYEDCFYITNILYRNSSSLEFELKEDTTVKAVSLNIYASKFNSYIESIKSLFNIFELNGLAFSLKTNSFKTLSKTNENTHVEVINKIGRRYTYINEFDELQCKNSRELVEDNKIIKAKNVVISAKDQVKIDGENIHLA